MSRDDLSSASPILVSSREFFDGVVSDAFEQRKLKTLPFVKNYLIDLLEFYVPTANLFDDFDASGRRVRETLAETLLKAHSSEPHVRNWATDRSISADFSEILCSENWSTSTTTLTWAAWPMARWRVQYVKIL